MLNNCPRCNVDMLCHEMRNELCDACQIETRDARIDALEALAAGLEGESK